MDAENDLPNDVLRCIVEGRQGNNVDDEAKKPEKTLASQSRSSSAPGNPGGLVGIDDNLAKVLAIRSRMSNDGTIPETDLVMMHREDEASIDFGPEPDNVDLPPQPGEEGLPGAYSGAPGDDYERVEPISRHLVGESTCQNEDVSEGEKPLNFPNSRLSVTDRTVDETDHPVEEGRVRPRRADGANLTASKCVKVLLMMVVALLILLAVVIPTVILRQEESDGNETSKNKTENQQDKPTRDLILVPNLTASTLEAIQSDPTSYQFHAYQLVGREMQWDTYEPWRKQQRFAMACVYYALGGAFWMKFDQAGPGITSWKFHLHECEWDVFADTCHDSGKLKSLILRNKHFRTPGSLPPEIAMLTELERIDFTDSQTPHNLETFFPPSIMNTSTLPSLREIVIHNVGSGSIPSTLGLLTLLTKLDLNKNDLTSTIPSELGLLPKLAALSLSKNELIGTIPKELGDLRYLTTFSTTENEGIEPFLPEGFCSEDHAPMELLSTNWCQSINECCSA